MGTAKTVDFTLAANGKPVATIVLPAETEYDRYVADRRQTMAAELDAAGLDDAARKKEEKKRLAAFEKHIAGVGDEEELAAEELQTIIEKISGALLPIVRVEKTKLPDGPVVVLGAELGRALGLKREIAALDKDGLICRINGRHLILTGQRARGTLYAVYTLLESIGCRWVMPGPFGETVTEEDD